MPIPLSPSSSGLTHNPFAQALPEFRQMAESRMTSRVTIHRKAGRTQDADGLDVDGWTTVASDVPFRLIRGNASRTVRVGESEVEVATRDGDLPVGTPLADNDLLDITVGEWAGRVVQVIDSLGADQMKSLRVPVFEVERPEEW